MNLMVYLINVQALNYIHDDTPTLNHVNFTLNAGELVYLNGESGSGKSTFLKILNRLLEPDSGKIEYRQRPYGSIDAMELRQKIQLVGQVPFLFSMSVIENFRLAAKSASDAQIEELMTGFNLPLELLEQGGKELSVGQAARICVIRSLLLEPEIILLDEPTAALDPENRKLFRSSFEAIRREKNLATVWVTHDTMHPDFKEGRCLTLKDGSFND